VGSVSAWIVTAGRADRECSVLDISPAGAKVVVQESSGVPNSFELAFFQSVDQRRMCEVVWRTGKVLGVRFVT
jgi:hypothetical protein